MPSVTIPQVSLIVKTVPLSVRVARQLDVLTSFNQSKWEVLQFVGRIDGETLFGREHYWEYMLVLDNDVPKLLSIRHMSKTQELPDARRIADLPKLVLL